MSITCEMMHDGTPEGFPAVRPRKSRDVDLREAFAGVSLKESLLSTDGPTVKSRF